MSFDLLDAGKKAVLAHQQSLQVTGKNINNINNEGYVRERTIYNSSDYGGLEGVTVERVIDPFVLKQLYRNISETGFQNAKLDQAEQLDKLMGNRETNVVTAIESFFNSLQDANSDPSSITARQIVITEAEGVATQFNSFSGYLREQEQVVNDRLKVSTEQINAITSNIAALNKEIATGSASGRGADINSLKNQQEEELRKLSELVSISTVDFGNGAVGVNMTNGTSLVLEDGKFNSLVAKSSPDTNRLELVIQGSNGSGDRVQFPVNRGDVGGELGGYLDYRDQILLPAQRSLGQLAVRFADTLNTQNQKGMDLDNQLGTKIFDLTDMEVKGLPFEGNSGSGNLSLSVLEGNSSQFTADNLKITKTGANEYTVQAADAEGEIIPGSEPQVITTSGAGSYAVQSYGVSLNIQNDSADTEDMFLAKPAENAAFNLDVNMRRPQDLALASPIRTITTADNEGSAELTISQLNTPDTFYNGNALDADAPSRFEFTNNGDGSYDVTAFDQDGDVFGQINGATSLENLVTQMTGDPEPDYDFSVDGVPLTGDSYTVEFNTNGINDNRNGQALADFQRETTVRRSSVDNAEPTLTFNDSYARIVSDVGSKVSQSRVAKESAEAIEGQTRALYDSASGVNLEEEASNLIRYEQAYNASARIITVAQDLFNTLLQAAR
ncbi:flagellar hook-associated protein 1 FlgK [Idiomarina fontislapidosi]|uniref:Flagellar hook-associated protein 1 n=1 Tax=Idiomarina fontislapidosi TaxID=263723 RepID=A0A432XYJ7_9GAMM|nr:flagellar hook-associated protein FlgK [Idiomarina fontislapidosi]PYE32770.1 flagellar hook-associated protein 1 FlgK [Idiomarina fontislapidosi]RUO53789.1 flagellar hook-associated protein FlgK [Idiomarina fontislapidosi]